MNNVEERVVDTEVYDKLREHPMYLDLIATDKYEHNDLYEHFRQSERESFMSGHVMAKGVVSWTPIFLTLKEEFMKDYNECYVFYYLGDGASGFPHMAHGGLVATLMDEALSHAARVMVPSKAAFTGTLKLDYLSPSPVNNFLIFNCWTENINGRRVSVKGNAFSLPSVEEYNTNGWGKPVVKGEAVFVEPKNFFEGKRAKL
jgi:Thioesterase superfamily